MRVFRKILKKKDYKIHSDLVVVGDKNNNYTLTDIFSPNEKYTATLQNGWTGSIVFRKNIWGTVSVVGDVRAGTITNGTRISIISENYSPSKNMAPVLYNSSLGRLQLGIIITENGTIDVRTYGNQEFTSNERLTFNTTYETMKD